MASKQNLYASATSSINGLDSVLSKGYPLKKSLLKKWIYDNDHTQSYVAKRLGLEPEEFKRKLRELDKFNEEQIKKLVYLMGAEAAFNVIYFPSNRKRKKVWWEAFGKYRGKEELNE